MRLSNTEMTISILRMPCDAFKWGRKGCASRHCSGNAGPLLAEVGGWQSPKRFGGSLEAAASCLSALSIQRAKAARSSQDEVPGAYYIRVLAATVTASESAAERDPGSGDGWSVGSALGWGVATPLLHPQPNASLNLVASAKNGRHRD